MNDKEETKEKPVWRYGLYICHGIQPEPVNVMLLTDYAEHLSFICGSVVLYLMVMRFKEHNQLERN